MHGMVDPPGVICALFAVQNGLCFHCDKPMIFLRTEGAQKALLATREHIYAAGNGKKGMHHNIVLAHARCNHDRGAKLPTDDQLQKAREIYSKLGITPFIPDAEYIKDEANRKGAGKLESKYKGSEFKFPTLGDVWPRKKTD